MFTFLAIILGGLLAFASNRANERERRTGTQSSDELVNQSILHSRQDLRLIAYLLGGILVMLGIIADRLP